MLAEEQPASSWVPNPVRITPLAAAKRSTVASAALSRTTGRMSYVCNN